MLCIVNEILQLCSQQNYWKYSVHAIALQCTGYLFKNRVFVLWGVTMKIFRRLFEYNFERHKHKMPFSCFQAISSVPDATVNYVIQPGETPEQNGNPRSFWWTMNDTTNEMLLRVYRALDFETTPRYTLTIKAAVSRLRILTYLHVCQIKCFGNIIFWSLMFHQVKSSPLGAAN